MDLFNIVSNTCFFIEVVLSICGVIFNMLFMIALVKKKILHTPSNAVLGCLCCSDILIGAISLFLAIPYIPSHLNVVMSQSFYVLIAVASLFIALVSIDRYVAICHPFSYLRYVTPKLYAVVSVISCILCVLVLGVAAFIDMIYSLKSALVVHTIIFTFTTLILVHCNLRIIIVIRKKIRDIAPIDSQNNEQQSRLRLEAKRYRIIVILVLVFVSSKLPCIISFLLVYIGKLELTVLRYLILLASKSLLLVEGVINPFVYYFRISTFRSAIKEVLCCKRQT